MIPRGNASIFWILCLLTVIALKPVLGQGQLTVPTKWYEGQRINIFCKIDTSVLTTCTSGGGTLGTTVFKKDNNPICTVQSSWEGSCRSDSPESAPDKCWCEQGSGGTTNYVYRIYGNPQTDNGTWTCEKGCTASGSLFPTPFTIDNSAGVQKNVSLNPCTTGAAQCSQTGLANCYVSDEGNVSCACKVNFKGTYCEQAIDNYPTFYGIGFGVGFGLILLVVVTLFILFCRGCLKFVKHPPLVEKTGTITLSCCGICISGPPAAAHDPKNSTTNSDHEPTPDYEKDAKKTGHKATGRPHNGVADEHV